MEAYITKSNAKNIIFNLDVSVIDIQKEIFRIEFKWFSGYEIRSILAYRLLFENPNLFFQKYLKKKAIDTKQYIFANKLPSYHSNENCERLLSKFLNYKIPDEIKEQGDEKIMEFRAWFIENIESFEKDPVFFAERLRMRFNLEIRPEVVNYENSGVQTFNNLNMEELDKLIVKKIENSESFYNQSEKNKIVLDNFGKCAFLYKEKKVPTSNNTAYSNQEIWEVLKEFDTEFKEPLISLLREYYRVQYNPEMKFEGQLLEQLGFLHCNQCENEILNKSANESAEVKMQKLFESMIKGYK